MKTSRLFAFMLSWLSLLNMAQGQSPSPTFYPRQYVVKVRLASHAGAEKGILYDLTDSTIVLAPVRQLKPTLRRILALHGGTLPPTDSLRQIWPLRTYRYADVRRLIVHRRGQVGLGTLPGAGLGAATGFSLGDDPGRGFLSFTGGNKAVLGAIGLSLPGVLTGVVMSKRINAKNQSVPAQALRRFQKFTIIDQLNQVTLYATPSDSPKKPLGRQWSLSVTMAGWQTFGPTSALKQKMNETGWASTEPKSCYWGWCDGPTDYPLVRRRPIFDLDLGYRVSARRGYQVSFGMPHNAGITGWVNRTPSAMLLYLHSRIWAASFRWAWFSQNGRWVGSAGPALLLFQTAQGRNDHTPFTHRHRQVRPGVHLSGQYRFIDRTSWLLALKTDVRLAWPASTRAYAVSNQYGPTYRLPETNIGALSLTVGLQVGFKFGKGQPSE